MTVVVAVLLFYLFDLECNLLPRKKCPLSTEKREKMSLSIEIIFIPYKSNACLTCKGSLFSKRNLIFGLKNVILRFLLEFSILGWKFFFKFEFWRPL